MSRTRNDPKESTKPETAESKVRRALEASPGATAATMAEAAGIARSTASKILARWAAAGLVTRTSGKDQSIPVTWSINDGPAEEAVSQQEDADPTACDDVEPSPRLGTAASPPPDTTVAGSEAVAPKKDRLPKGGLYDLVKDFLHQHSGEAFGPAKIGVELVRSSGAVNNALEKLVLDGLATKTCEAPKRFSWK